MVWWSGGLLVATWLLLDTTTAGFSCLSSPCLYGICMDDLNSSFTCYCIDGYTGIHCQTNWDECWSSPCFNGGFCQDGVASYNCSCPDGFVGDLCEENVDECISNPCHNNGTCVDAANSYSCQCAPGYSGTHCELDIAVCNSTEESEGVRCHNGGVCIEGQGIQFSCFCTPGWTGKLCEIPIDECASNPCQNGAVCIDLPASYSCACLFGFTGRDCDLVLSMCTANLCDNDALCLVEDDTSVCYCVPDYHGDRCQFQYDECLLGHGCKNGGTCIDGVDSFSCSCPPDLTGHLCECLILNDSSLDCSYIRPSTSTALPTTIMSSTSTTIHSSSYVPTTHTFFTTTEFFTTFLETSSTVHSTSDTMSTTALSTTKVLAEESSPTVPTAETTATPQEETTSFSDTTTELIVTSDTLDLITTKPTEITDESVSVLPTSETTDVTRDLDKVGQSDSTDEYKTTAFVTTTEETKPISLEPREPTSGLLNVSSTTELQTTTIPIDTTTVESLECSGKTSCLNGGTCYITADGKRCKCRQGWIGFQCEEREAIDEAAFTGHSYLTHRLANQSSTEVSVVIRTLAPTGLIIHANTAPYIHLAVFLHEGLLKFVFTCGIQTMLFSELHERVDTGFPLSITAKLEVEGAIGEQHCSASLGVNESLAMSGEQRALSAPLPDWRHHQALLHLGGVPPQRRPAVNIPVTLGVTGCMQGLTVNGVAHNIFGDAVDVFEVSQCSSLACLSNPCHSAATCVEHGDSWACLCPSGLVGVTCEKSVCLNNPCQFGGTCSPFPGTGFICLCPFGKHGLYCQKDLEIGHPLYSSSVRGLASFSAYPVPGALHNSFEIRFRFTTQMMEQVALLLFIGQDHIHDATSDHLAVSFIKGYIVLTWNLGSGPRRIFTPRSVPAKTGSVHLVKFGRVGRKAWLQVDNLDNVTGSSPGRMIELNTQPIVYIGGHKFRNLSGLPHDLPLHTGFSGCVYSVEWRVGRVSVPISQVRAVTVLGRNVGQCGTSHCHNTTCLNGGACIDHGATFTCLCKDGWFGPVCALRFNPCDSTRHNCSSGATCVPLETGYECDCPFGKVGRHCEKEEVLTDISLTGRRSFIAVPSADLHLLQICVEFELRPAQDKGLVFFTGHLQGQTFISIALHGGILELRLKTIGQRRSGDVLVVRSSRVLSLATWHLVRAGRYGNRVFLSVDGAVTTATLLQGESIVASKHPIFLGGVVDLSDMPPGAMTGLPVPLTGCVRRLVLNWHPVPLTMAYVLSARNVADCDGTACGGDVCLNSGTCWLDTSLKPHCTCTQEYMGEKCESPVSCLELPCENNGVCVTNHGVQPECQCPVGWEGPFCSKALAQGAAHFDGDSYLLMESSASLIKRGQDNSLRRKDIEFLFVNFSTVYTQGMILWSAQDDEFIGVGIEAGQLQVAWSWKGVEPSIVLLPEPNVADGNWHCLTISLTNENVTILCDQSESVTLPSKGHRPILTNGVFHLGGFPSTRNTFSKTKGIYRETFRGCVQEVAWSGHSSVTNFSKYMGENIKSCALF